SLLQPVPGSHKKARSYHENSPQIEHRWRSEAIDMLEDPVSVANYKVGAASAEVLRAALDAAGVAAFVGPHQSGEVLSWVEVYVSKRDRERAEAIIEDIESERREREEAEKSGYAVVRCLACGRPMTSERCRRCGWSWLDGGEATEPEGQS